MAVKNVITLGIGASPGSVAAFVLTGLHTAATSITTAPSSVKFSSVFVGAEYVTADGSSHLDYVAAKKRISLTYEQVTTATRDNMRTLFVGGVSFSLTVPDDATYTVFPVRGQYKHAPTGGASETWTVNAMVEVV